MPQSPVPQVDGAPSSAPGPIGVGTDELDTPCLLLDLDKLDANIESMAELAASAGVALRPHAKTHKLAQVAARQIAAGSQGLTVAKLGEAEMLVGHGIEDILIAYPLWGARKWERLGRLSEAAEIRVAADSYEVFEGIAAAARCRGLSIPVRIEVDTGYARCGVQSPVQALALADRLSRLEGVRLVGVMSFAGQTYAAERGHTEEVAAAEAARLLEAAQALRSGGFAVPEVSAGSTPSATHVHALSGITEIRPGTYVFSDRDQAALGWRTLQDCALTALATVVSHPTPTRAIVDAGTKTLTSDQTHTLDGFGAVVGHPEWQLVTLNEEHGILEVPPGEAPIGSQVEIIPNHACGALNLHDWVAACRDGGVVEWWRVEGRGLIR